MARRLFIDKLVDKSSINEELRLINGSLTDYITPTGKIYKLYDNGLYFQKKTYISSSCGYTYCGITFSDGINRQRRVHRLVAEAYLPNPNNLPFVGHKNNIKSCTDVTELYWTDAKESTKRAYDDNLAHTDKGFNDSQSFQIDVYDLDGNFIETCGSVKETAKAYGVSPSTVLRHCRNEVSTYRASYTFRFIDDDFSFSID